MSQYKVPVRDIMFAIEHLADLEGVSSLPGYEEATPEVIDAILVEAGKLAEEVLDPLNRVGDQQGVKLENGHVRTPDGWVTPGSDSSKAAGMVWRSTPNGAAWDCPGWWRPRSRRYGTRRTWRFRSVRC